MPPLVGWGRPKRPLPRGGWPGLTTEELRSRPAGPQLQAGGRGDFEKLFMAGGGVAFYDSLLLGYCTSALH